MFTVIEVVPGDPAAYMLGLNASEDTVAALRTELGLDGSVPERYLGWVGGMLVGDFGTSYTYRTARSPTSWPSALVVSLPLAILALLLAVGLAFPAGILAASRRGGAADTAVMGASQLGIAIPNFWFAMLLVLLFAIHLRWLPSGGFPGWEAGIGGGAALARAAGRSRSRCRRRRSSRA